MTAHAKYSASGAHRWLRCPGSLAAEEGQPDTSGAHAREGTAAHELGELCLSSGNDADAFLGRVITVEGQDFAVDQDMAAYVQEYVDAVREQGRDGTILVEQRVDYAGELRAPAGSAFGTADAIVVTHDGELQVHDLKYGRGVEVSATDNDQLQLYAIGAIAMLDMVYSFDRVRVFIHQPRLGASSEWAVTLDELSDFATIAADTIEQIEAGEGPLVSGDKQCRFCKAKATCPALAGKVAEAVTGQFADLDAQAVADATDDVGMLYNDALAKRYQLVDLVETWCKAIKARVADELAAGRKVPGFKLVAGKRGHRKWTDEDEAAALLKSFRLKIEEMYDLSLISPTSADKLVKAGTIGPRQAPKLKALVTQPDGKPTVAPETDPRPALAPTVDDFENLEEFA